VRRLRFDLAPAGTHSRTPSVASGRRGGHERFVHGQSGSVVTGIGSVAQHTSCTHGTTLPIGGTACSEIGLSSICSRAARGATSPVCRAQPRRQTGQITQSRVVFIGVPLNGQMSPKAAFTPHCTTADRDQRHATKRATRSNSPSPRRQQPSIFGVSATLPVLTIENSAIQPTLPKR